MPLARIVTRYPDEALELAMQLRARGFQVETVDSAQVPESQADLEIQLDTCNAQDVLQHVMGLSVDGSSVFVAPGSLNNGGFSEMPPLPIPHSSVAARDSVTVKDSPAEPEVMPMAASELPVASGPRNGVGEAIRWRIVEDAAVRQETFAFESQKTTLAPSDPIAEPDVSLEEAPVGLFSKEAKEDVAEETNFDAAPRIELQEVEIEEKPETEVATANIEVAKDEQPRPTSVHELASALKSEPTREVEPLPDIALKAPVLEAAPEQTATTPAFESNLDTAAEGQPAEEQTLGVGTKEATPSVIPLGGLGEFRRARALTYPVLNKRKADPIFWKIAIAAASLAACVVILGSIWQQKRPSAGSLPSPAGQKMPFQKPGSQAPSMSPQPGTSATTTHSAPPQQSASPQASTSSPAPAATTSATGNTTKPTSAKSTASKKQTPKKTNRAAQHHVSNGDSGYIAKDTVTYFDRKASHPSAASNSSSK